VTELYSIQDVARIFGLQPSRLRYWAQTGFVGPSARRGGRRVYTFRDLIAVRAAKELLDAGISMQRVRKNLESLRTLLPDDEPAATMLRISSDGETLVAIADDVAFEPETRQTIMSFEVSSLSSQVAQVLALPVDRPSPGHQSADPFAAQGQGREGGRPPRAQFRTDGEPVEDGAGVSRDLRTPSSVRMFEHGGVTHRSGPAQATDPQPAENRGAIPGRETALETALKTAADTPIEAIADAAPEPVDDDPTESHPAATAYQWFLLGCQAEDRRDDAAAERAYRHAVELEPSFAAAHTNLGNLLYRRGDALGARLEYELALAHEPAQAEARFNLGNVLEDIGETEQAIEEMRRVVRVNPDFADAHYNLALMLARVGGIKQARHHLEQYIELDRDSEWHERASEFASALA
jgi:tetratricopeptide (TPR) repeat protein